MLHRSGVSAMRRSSLLAPFQVPSFRFQYPALRPAHVFIVAGIAGLVRRPSDLAMRSALVAETVQLKSGIFYVQASDMQ